VCAAPRKTSWGLQAVSWDRLADHFLGGIPGYRSGRGEFRRTPGAQGNNGRDHKAAGFSMWMAGGGVKGGQRDGATDEHGIAAVQDKMHINDLHATMLYLLGFDREKLTDRYSGRDFRLTDLAEVVAKGVLA